MAQKKPILLVALATFLCLGLLLTLRRWAEVPGCPASHIKTAATLKESGGRVDWSHANNLIAFDSLQEDGYYDVSVMEPDGTNEKCLTCGKEASLPQRHLGNPAWHPSGDYLVFQAEKESHPGVSASSTPGFGLYSDLWLASSDGQSFFKITDTPNTENSGVLHPHFSPDGKLLSWSELYEKPRLLKEGKEFGYWKLKVADFSLDDGRPRLSNIREYEPGGPAFYENHGFSPDGDKLIFSSNFGRDGSTLQNTNIFVMDLKTKSVTALTDANYNEHAIYSPDGEKIVWMSSAESDRGATDYWVMNADGSNKERLTYFNSDDCPESTGETLVVADSSWGPDGNKIVAYVSTNLIRQRGKIVMIELGD